MPYNISPRQSAEYDQYSKYRTASAGMLQKNAANNSHCPSAHDRSSRFDTFDNIAETAHGENKGVCYTKPKAAHAPRKTPSCDPTEEQMRKTFGIGDDYEILSGKTDEFGTYMIRSTKSSTIYIHPDYYASIADDPEKIKGCHEMLESMKRIDQRVERRAKAKGIKIVSKGWYIDKDGGVSSWTITKREKKIKKTQLEKMRDLQRKIAQKRTEKKKSDIKIAKKRSEQKEELLRLRGKKKLAMSEKFKRKAKNCVVIDLNDLEIMRRTSKLKTKTITSFGSGYSI